MELKPADTKKKYNRIVPYSVKLMLRHFCDVIWIIYCNYHVENWSVLVYSARDMSFHDWSDIWNSGVLLS